MIKQMLLLFFCIAGLTSGLIASNNAIDMRTVNDNDSEYIEFIEIINNANDAILITVSCGEEYLENISKNPFILNDGANKILMYKKDFIEKEAKVGIKFNHIPSDPYAFSTFTILKENKTDFSFSNIDIHHDYKENFTWGKAQGLTSANALIIYSEKSEKSNI